MTKARDGLPEAWTRPVLPRAAGPRRDEMARRDEPGERVAHADVVVVRDAGEKSGPAELAPPMQEDPIQDLAREPLDGADDPSLPAHCGVGIRVRALERREEERHPLAVVPAVGL